MCIRDRGWGEYVCPKMVLYHGSIQSGCGNATAQVGPFYCSADQTIYIDLDFFRDMQTNIGGGGDFAYAYVIAHEVGHHVQYLLGTLDQGHNLMAQLPESEANKISVRMELQADYYAGVWGHLDNEMSVSYTHLDVYKRQTPYCITVDHQTLEDGTVTLRERDSMEQTRVAISDLHKIIHDKVSLTSLLRKLA